MRKTLLLSIATTTLLLAQNADLEKAKQEIENLQGFKNFNTKVMEIQHLEGADGWYAIKGLQDTNQGKRSFDMVTNKEVVVFGNAFSLKDGKNLSVKTDFAKLKSSASYKIGNGKEEFFLVTDPECPYCQRLEEKLHLLKDKATIYVYMTADIIPSHLAAKGMINYINSFPEKDRGGVANKIFLEKDKTKLLKTIDKYNIEMYTALLQYKSNPEARGLASMYLGYLSQAFGVKLDTDAEQNRFLNDKIKELSKTDYAKLDKEYTTTQETIDIHFKPNGTPTVFDAAGNKLSNQFEMFAKLDAYDMDKIRALASDSELMVKAGKKGAKKAYYFISTQCPACINDFNNKEKLDKLLAENEVYFFLGVNGGDYQTAEKELKYILSQKDDAKKLEALKSIMAGQKLNQEQLNTQIEPALDSKISKFAFQDQFETFVMATPTIIFEKK